MPWIEAALTHLNAAISTAMNGGKPSREELAVFFAEDAEMSALFGNTALNLNRGGHSLATFREWPRAMSQATRTAIRTGLLDEDVGSLTIDWAAGYDYSVAIHQSKSYGGKAATESAEAIPASKSGLTIRITTRYPFDPHPSLVDGPTSAV